MDKNLEKFLLSLVAGVYNLPAGTIDGLNIESLTKLFKPTDSYILGAPMTLSSIPAMVQAEEIAQSIYKNNQTLNKYNTEIQLPKLIDSESDPININSGLPEDEYPHSPLTDDKRFSSKTISQFITIAKCEIMYDDILLGTVMENDPITIDMTSFETIRDDLNQLLLTQVNLIKNGKELDLDGMLDAEELDTIKTFFDDGRTTLVLSLVQTFGTEVPFTPPPQETA